MIVYMCLYIFILFVSIFSIIKNKQKIGFIILSTLISVLTMIRFDTGWDYYWYWYTGDTKFKSTYYYEYAYNNVEFFYKRIYDIVRFVNYPPLFFIITGGIMSFFVFKSLYKQCKYPLIGLAIYIYGMYFFVFSLGFVRQYLALSIVFFAYQYIYTNKIKYMLIILVTTYFFHYSAIVALSFLIVEKIKLKYILILLPLIIVLKKLFFHIAFFLSPKYINYLNANKQNPIIFQFLMYILFGIFIAIFEVRTGQTSQENLTKKIFWTGISLYLILNYLFGGHLGYRISIYFIIFSVYYFSNSILLFKQKKLVQIIFLFFFFSLGSFSIIRGVNKEEIFSNEERRTFNYEFIFNKNELNFNQRQLP